MDPYSAILLQWLQGMAADANLRPAKRIKASYIANLIPYSSQYNSPYGPSFSSF